MQTKDLTRGERRARRLHAIEHAFDVYWNKWGRWNDTFRHHLYVGYERIYLETEDARRQMEDEARAECLITAKRVAKHLRNCSCFMCSGYKKYEKTPKQLRARYQDEDEVADLWGEEKSSSHDGIVYNDSVQGQSLEINIGE